MDAFYVPFLNNFHSKPENAENVALCMHVIYGLEVKSEPIINLPLPTFLFIVQLPLSFTQGNSVLTAPIT